MATNRIYKTRFIVAALRLLPQLSRIADPLSPIARETQAPFVEAAEGGLVVDLPEDLPRAFDGLFEHGIHVLSHQLALQRLVLGEIGVCGQHGIQSLLHGRRTLASEFG